MHQPICQSCAMPMGTDDYGTNKDGAPNETYCKYCYQEGAFTSDSTMEQMIDLCVPHMATPETGIKAEDARTHLEKIFPTLERWKQA